MAYDDDLFDEEYDFGDDEDDSDTEDSEVDEADSDVKEKEPAPAKPKRRSTRPASSQGPAKRSAKKPPAAAPAPAVDEGDDEFAEEVDEPDGAAASSGPPLDHVVHIYEFGKFKRTVRREFTDEDAITFAEEFNRTSKNYGRHAVPVERNEEPEPHL